MNNDPSELSRHHREEALFELAVEKDGVERDALLQALRADDPALESRLKALLAAHEQEDNLLLEAPETVCRPNIVSQNASPEEGVGQIIGHYRLLEKVGEGGCGVVYVAEQTEPVRRRVALKVIKLGMDTKAVVARFEAERQALALMDHPNIAKVLDAGSTETGRPYFVMELVRGVRITQYCDEHKLPTPERVKLFMEVCRAVQHAHQKGIIHRDIKPSNILVTLMDGVPVPKVIDFGIAKATAGRLTEATVYTQLHQLMGTPAYMSPEQAEMTSVDVDTRSDIYSLGVLLYELLTGRTPFDSQELLSAGLDAMRHKIRETEPLRPSTRLAMLNPEELTTAATRRSSEPPSLISLLKGDLDWVVMKCLEKDRTRRYETANGLAADLQRHLNRQPVIARPPTSTYRLQKFIGRNRLMVLAVAAVAAVLLLGILVSTWEAVQARAEKLFARQQAYAADINLAQHALVANDLGRARRLLEGHQPRGTERDLRAWEWRYLWQACRSDARSELCRYPDSVFSVSYAPNGKLLAVAGYGRRFVDLWDAPAHRKLARLQDDHGHVLAFAPVGDLLATDAEVRGERQIWLWQGTNLLARMPTTAVVVRLKFSPDATRLASLTSQGELTVWDVARRTPAYQIAGLMATLAGTRRGLTWNGLDFSPDGKTLLVGAEDYQLHGRICGLDVATGNTNFIIPEAHSQPIILAWSPRGNVIASASGYSSGEIRLWEANSKNLLGGLLGHTSCVRALIFSPDGERLFSASSDQTIRIWNVAEQRCLATLKGCSDEVCTMALSPDETTLVTGTKDGVVAFWDAVPHPAADMHSVIPCGEALLPAASFSHDSRVLAVLRNGTVTLMDPASSEEIEQLPALGTNNTVVTYSPDGSTLVSGAHDGTIRVWSCAQRRLSRQFNGHQAQIRGLLFRADSRRLFCVDSNWNAIWWDTQNWQQARRPFSVKGTYIGAVSPDGRLIAAGTPGGLLRWLDGETGQALATTSGHRHLVMGVAFSPDGQRVASVGEEGMVALWDASSFKLITSFKGHMHEAHSVTFSPDGRRLATGGSTGPDAIKLWDLSTHRELITLSAEGSLVRFVTFSPDGAWLAARVVVGKELHLWHAPSAQLTQEMVPRPPGG